ncbi:MAG: hypothetical protein OXL68_07375 [Paracoccaceae bacterium]|nr:hypothetical protein [Paracoccaceae bacterium]
MNRLPADPGVACVWVRVRAALSILVDNGSAIRFSGSAIYSLNQGFETRAVNTVAGNAEIVIDHRFTRNVGFVG